MRHNGDKPTPPSELLVTSSASLRPPAGSGSWSNLTDTSAYTGSATASLAITAGTSGMNGDAFRCVVSNGASTSATSTLATLTVIIAPTNAVISIAVE